MTAVDHGFASEAERLSASPRLFDNALLDKLSRVHWSVPLFVYVPVIAGARRQCRSSVVAPLDDRRR